MTMDRGPPIIGTRASDHGPLVLEPWIHWTGVLLGEGNKGEHLKGPQMLAPRQSGRLGPGRRQVQV